MLHDIHGRRRQKHSRHQIPERVQPAVEVIRGRGGRKIDDDVAADDETIGQGEEAETQHAEIGDLDHAAEQVETHRAHDHVGDGDERQGGERDAGQNGARVRQPPQQFVVRDALLNHGR